LISTLDQVLTHHAAVRQISAIRNDFDGDLAVFILQSVLAMSAPLTDWKHLFSLARAEVNATVSALPAKLREEARRVPITLRRRPSQAMEADGIEPDTLGLFVGDAFPDQDSEALPLPAQVLLFLENLWDFAERDEKTFRREIRTTLLHELGHFLGLDEIDLEERGLE
jgi:predicted Zn-dependent protease with MMP-like domain